MTETDAGSMTFSSSWHRVAQVRLGLRPSVRAHRQEFRGDLWYVLQDPFNNAFFRITVDAYAFLCQLESCRTVEEAWLATLEANPDRALGQEEVVQLLGQLNMSNLLVFDSPAVAASIFDRYRLRRKQELKARVMGLLLSIRIPLFDPDPWLERARPLIRLMYGPLGWGLWGLLLLLAARAVMEQWDRLFIQAAGMLAPGNLLLLYGSFLLAKIIHELGHATACKYFGGEVHELGVMLVVFTPMPYVDATASWGFPMRWQRVLVGAAGMLAEFAVGAVAALVWAASAPGTVHAVAYNVLFVTTVSTLLFNINPLLRFDGYYMLSDWLGIPNLYQRSREQLRHMAESALFGVRVARTWVHAPLEGGLVATYGILSLLYWVLVISGILLFVADQYLDVGVLLALLLFATSVLGPVFRLLRYLWQAPRLEYHRLRAVSVILLLVGSVVGVLTLLPLPDRVRAPGIVEAVDFRELNSQSAGLLVALLAEPGQTVTTGQPLVRLHAPDLETEIRSNRMQYAQLLAQRRRAESESVADLAPLQEQLAVTRAALDELLRRQESLTLTAPIQGLWSAPGLDNMVGSWMPRGTALGMIVDPKAFRFVAVLPQVATHLFGHEPGQAEVRLNGQEGVNLRTGTVQVLPFQHGALPSPALGWAGGGEVAVDPSDPRGVMATEPFFLIRAGFLEGESGHVRMVHGRSGTMRIDLGRTPLWWQWERSIRQFLQQTYRVL
jgi:putative peptide zinc metalloprotease protein